MIDPEFISFQEALAGEYSLERELGRGGMGIVYLAREVSLDRLVALKILPPRLAAQPALRERFLREARTAARLSHPNIVPIFRVGERADFVYFAMAYVEGETLGSRVRSHGPLSPHEGARVLREAAWALAYAHARGIVHRDVKPENILIERGSGRAMLTDFGIARAEKTPDIGSDAGLVLGSAHYMSPEQASGEALGARSDLYSLGIVAHVALSGRLPFDAPSTPALLAKQISEPASPLASVAPAVPRSLCEAVDRCLAKDPARRFASGEALAEALTGASETPRVIPAPLRVWIARSEQTSVMRVVGGVYLGVAALPLMASGRLLYAALPIGLVAAITALPALVRIRRVLAAGYGVDDIRDALRGHIQQRREEIAYESRVQGTRARNVAVAISAVSWTVLIFATRAPLWQSNTRSVIAFAAAAIGSITSVLAVGAIVRERLRHRFGQLHLAFWNSRWGERFLRLARVGLAPVAPASALSQVTEIALGRATDLLFQALPAEARRDLRGLPDAVRTLERDAGALRVEIEKLGEQLAQFDRVPSISTSSSIAGASSASSAADEHAAVRAELIAVRDAAQRRLAETVTALENIRLGLLRLQIGSIGVESVTAAVEAAERVARDVHLRAAAEEEVRQVLTTPLPHPSSG